MGQKKIIITPFFKAWIYVVAKRVAGRLGGLVPGHSVLVVAIVGGQIETAAHPPDRRFPCLLRHEHPDIRMGGGRMRISGVDH